MQTPRALLFSPHRGPPSASGVANKSRFWGGSACRLAESGGGRRGWRAVPCRAVPFPRQLSAVGYGMDEAEQDQSEARLKELFDSFDVTGTGSLGHEELTELCHVLQLETVAPGALQQTLLQGDLLSRVHFDQFKEALILILSRTLTNEESFQEPDSSPEAQPKYIKGGKRYGRRSLPEFQKSVEDFAEVTVIEPLNEEAQPSCISNNDCEEHWRSQDSEEYEAEGQLRFWNPDDLNASPNISPPQDWIEEKLHEVCESLGISRDGHLSRRKLVSICKQYGLQNVDMQVAEDVFRNLEHDGTMSIEDFFYGFFKIGKPLPPSASTPYRQLKRHLSMQSFDECGRRTTTPSAMTSTIGFRVFSSLDDGMGYADVEQILDAWQEEGIENSHEILKALDFNLDGRINLTELTLALENELLITKNGIYQAVLASFKTEIRHLMEQADQEVREKEKLRLDLEKAEKWKLFMTSEVDERHSAIERQNEYNLSKLEEEYKERVAALKSELQREREQIQQQASKQQADLEEEMAKLRTEENDLRECLALTLKENSRLENELQETGEKLLKCEGTISKLQKNWENVLAEKYGDLDPSSAEFFLQEERLMQMKNTYEQQCRELQDQIDELQSQLEEYQGQGRVARSPLKASLYEELDDDGAEGAQAPGSEDCNPLNMSIEAEMAIEQLKDQHQQDLCSLQEELQNRLCHYQKQLEESKTRCAKEQEILQQHHAQERQALEEQVDRLQAQVSELQEELERLRQEWQEADSQQKVETGSLQVSLEEKASLVDQLKLQHQEELQARLQEAREGFGREREELVQARVRLEEKMRAMVQTVQEEKAEMEGGFHEQLRRLEEKLVVEKEALQQELARKYREELEEERGEMDRLREENALLRNKIAFMNEEGSICDLRLRELNGSREELWQQMESVQKEKVAVQKMAENLKKQASELKARNQQLEFENAELDRKTSPHQVDAQDLNQRLRKVLRQKEVEKGVPEEREGSWLQEELENWKIQSSTLEMELSQLRAQALALEQENYFLKEELGKGKQIPRCPDLSDLQNEISGVLVKNEKLLKEKEALSEELNRCAQKVAKVAFLEDLVASLKQEKSSLEHQNQILKTQKAASQDKMQNFDDAVQNAQVSRLKSDLRVSQQEKEVLKQEVMSLHKQLQTSNDKNRALEAAVHSAGLQSQQKQLCWGDEVGLLAQQDQQLLRQDNERLQQELQSASSDLARSREKIRQLESTILTQKHLKHQSHLGIVNAIEQEKASLKRECEKLQKELASANWKISQMSSLERELEAVNLENEGLRKKQVKRDEQVMELLHSSSSVMLSPSQHPRDLQQQGCPVVPWEEYQQLQRQFLQEERRCQRLQEELENRPLETNMPQGGQEHLLKTMEKRMMDVEQQLRLVKRLLQDKVNQLKEQLAKNTKADEMVKDLFVENAQLLKALEMTERRQKTVEKKNYLLEEKIANLGRIVKNLTSPTLGSAAQLGS
uniref:LOW QUALITY PROTEIN: ninein n=1 Tax=Podarcis muralis TaxID=64176 RepID=UPI00109F78D3|nr:LOW QUALITY PROTEIN: ninein [Podarcis muralis]